MVPRCNNCAGNDCAGKTCNGIGQCHDGINDYSCECNPGYTGKDCEKSNYSTLDNWLAFIKDGQQKSD